MLPKFMTIFDGLNVPLADDDPNPRQDQPCVRGFLVADARGGDRRRDHVQRFQATEHGRRKIDHWRMNAPVFGKVVS